MTDIFVLIIVVLLSVSVWGVFFLLIQILTAIPSDFSSISTTMSDDGDHTCPLCAEEMDITDQQLKPCKCGYDVCISIILLSDQSDCMPLLLHSHNHYELKQLTAIYSLFLVYVPTLQICVWCWHHIFVYFYHNWDHIVCFHYIQFLKNACCN